MQIWEFWHIESQGMFQSGPQKYNNITWKWGNWKTCKPFQSGHKYGIGGMGQFQRQSCRLGNWPDTTPKGTFDSHHWSQKTDGNFCANVEKLCAIASGIALSTAEAERVCSDVNRTIAEIRNRLNLESCHKLLHIHRNNQFLVFPGLWESGLQRKIEGF